MTKKKPRIAENSGDWHRVKLKRVKTEAKFFKTD